MANGVVDTPTMAKNAVAEDDLIIPIIDFGQFLDPSGPSAREKTARAVLDGFRTAGFIYLSNHGIPAETIEDVFSSSASFFKRPQQQKDALAWTTPESNRGYVAHGREKVSLLTDKEEVEKVKQGNPDLKESMEIGREGVDQYPNNWPDRFDEEGAAFKRTMTAFHETCKKLHMEVMRAIAVGMALDETYFDQYTDAGDNVLRLLHYPAVDKTVFQKNKGQVRAGIHSDYGSITLLFQDSRGGLQVQSPNGKFVNATPIPNTIVVNAGDMLARWSNDTIKSTKHRVVEPPVEPDASEYPARYSVAYFCNPNFDKYIEAIPGTWEKEGKKYPGINSFDYITQRLAATY